MKIECGLHSLNGDWWFDVGISFQQTKIFGTHQYVATLALGVGSVYFRWGGKKNNVYECKEAKNGNKKHVLQERDYVAKDRTKPRPKQLQCINCGKIVDQEDAQRRSFAYDFFEPTALAEEEYRKRHQKGVVPPHLYEQQKTQTHGKDTI